MEPFIAKPNAKVLDVGSGSGYLVSIALFIREKLTISQTTCFGRMVGEGGKVIGIDVIPELVQMALHNIKKHDNDLLDSKTVEIKCIK